MASILVLGIVGVLIAIVVTLFCLLVFSGLFHAIEIGTKKSPVSKLHIAYKFARGSYSEGGPLWTEVSKEAPNLRCIGVYYDDPNTVRTANLRYIVGMILSEGDDEPDKELEERLVAKGFKTADFPEVSTMVQTTFPFTTTLSIYIAIFRVYPALHNYVKANDLCAYPFIELYDNGLIHFLAPLSKQKDFYVPETGGVEIGELSAGQLDEDEEGEDQETSQRSVAEDEPRDPADTPGGEDSTNSDSSFEQVDPPEMK
ncbi:testis-expressed protein 264-like [Acanthaster planci]|uniref:Testis-expressed protein 264-like n=1 Tax=Acanthaster planci TaxID=133434 RepID=A0A8B7Z1J1_ACAPL|nr:testis-expressed protein 264-like [Acanthaster planci]